MMCSMTRGSTSRPLYWALLSAFLSKSSRNRDDFSGQRPCDSPQALAWAQRPTPPLNTRKGTHSFFWITFFKNLNARPSGIFFMALAVSHVFLKDTRRLEPLALQLLVPFSGCAL